METDQHVEVSETLENSKKANKRKRQNTVLDTFTKLTNVQENIRIKASVELLKHLTDTENRANDDDELKYALGRLVRGLGSAKIQAKAGFFVALVGLLNFCNVSVEQVFECVAKELHKGGSNSKSENADICSGQILVAGAILRSNLYNKCDNGAKTKTLQVLIEAGKERSYLGLASYKFLTDLFEKIEHKEFEKLIFPLIKDELSRPWEVQNLDSLYVLLSTETKFPQIVKPQFLKNNLGTKEILCQESLPKVCNVLTTILRIQALKHPIFDIITEKIANSSLIMQFFEELDRTLIRTNRNKFFVVTKLLSGILPQLRDLSILPDLLTKNYLQQTINTYKTNVGRSKDKEFQETTQKLFEIVLQVLKQENTKDRIKLKVLKRLLFYPGTFIFEKVTKSKLIQNITVCLKSEGVKKLATIYKEVVLASKDKVINEHSSERWWNLDRIYASHLLVKLINHPCMHDEKEWKIEQLIFLMNLGLLRGQSENVGNELADAFKETFYSALDLKLNKLDDLRFILSRTVIDLATHLTEDNQILRVPLSKDNYETWKHTLEIARKIEGKHKKKNVVFHILFLHLSLQLFNNAKLACDSLEELFSCYERVKKSKKTDVDISDDPLWIEVVVDLFLNLLSHNSHLIRSVINCVFSHLCKYLNATAVHQILAVLDPKNETNPLSNSTEESDSEENYEDDNEAEESTESEEDKEADENDREDTATDKLRLALQQVLGSNVDSDAESMDLDHLDDYEGEKLDEALGQAFSQFKPNLGRKKKQAKDDQILTHFRVRVLDLIEIYLNTSPSMLLTLEIMLPLLQVLEFSIRDQHQKPLQDRVRACLKKLCGLKKFEDFDGVTNEVLVDLLKSLLEKGTKNAIIIQDMGEKIADSCIFIVNCSQIVNYQELSKEISTVVANGLESFFKRRDCLIPYVLFKDILQLNWKGILDLTPLLSSFIFDGTVRPFRRNQATELLKIFYHNQRFFSTNKDKMKTIKKQTSHFLENAINFFGEFNSNPPGTKIKEKFLGGLFEVLSGVKSLDFEFNNWQIIGDLIRECRSQISFSKDTKLAFNKLCKNLNVSNIVPMKEKTVKLTNFDEDENNKEEGGEKKNKTNKGNARKEKLKLKKEAKKLRLEALSEGMGTRKIPWQNGDASLGEDIEVAPTKKLKS